MRPPKLDSVRRMLGRIIEKSARRVLGCIGAGTIDCGQGRVIHLPFSGGPHLSRDEVTNLRHAYFVRLFQGLMRCKRGAFLDVGAHLGQTFLKFLLASEGRDYYGFEPNVAVATYLEAIIRENRIEGAHVLPIGLSDHACVAKLCLRSGGDSAGSIVEGFREERFYSEWKHVPVFMGDDVIEWLGISKVSVIKIDVEGGELEVLNGLDRTIGLTRPFIVCEVLPIYDERTGVGEFRRSRADKVEEFLEYHRYRILRIREDDRPVELPHIETHDNLELCEYLFVPSEEVDTVQIYD